jgi:multidrug efflux pump subunit AcrB
VVKDKVAKIPGIVDANNGVVYDSPSLRIAPRGSRIAALGITTTDVGDAVSALTQGTVATNVAGAHSLIPVRVSLATPGNTTSNENFGSTPLFAKGATTSLGDVASINAVRLQTDINAINGQSVVRVTANISGANLSAVTAGIARVLKTTAFPPGYSAEIGGQSATQKQSFGEFLTVIAIAVALVFAVMLATFRSYRLPLVILTAIPLALIGVAIALFVTGTPFNVSSFMGLLLLVGVVVKNGILLIDVANKRVRAGDSIEDALVAAGKTRLRPIVMTTLAAIGGLVPLALGIGQGSEMERPLAIAVIGGLSTATIFTLLVIPALYAAFLGEKPPASIAQPVAA